MTALLRQALRSVGVRLLLAVLVAVLAIQGWTYATASGKVEPAVWDVVDAEGSVRISVELPFPPERFHILAMQKHGRLSGTDDHTVELRSVTRAGVTVIARLYWVREITLAEEQ